MALVQDAFYLSVSLADNSGSISTLEYQLQAGDAAGAATAAAAMIPIIEAVTDSVISGYSISERYYEDALTLPANAENAIKAVITMQLDGSNKKAVVRIPAPTADVFTAPSGAGANVVGTTKVIVQNYAGMFVAGAQANISDGENIAALPDSVLAGRRTSVRSSNP